MGTKFYQACFTRVDTGDLYAGWQVVNPSVDIMQSMVSFFESNEKANDVSVNQTNPDGSPLRVTKIICDQKNIGLIQVQYGLSDKNGRARFFSHGYVAGDPYEVLKNPEEILGLSEENFHFRVEETQSMPSALVYDRSFDEKDIMEKYDLTPALCVQFIRCALFPLLSSTQTTVFVKTDGSRAMAMDLLYLLYHALPYSLRPKVTASTYAKPMGANSMYVFTKELPEIGSFVDPLTGKNNILGGAYEKRLEKYSFVTEYARHMPQTMETHDGYYMALEKVLRDMGDIHLTKMEALRLAYRTYTSAEITDNEIGGLLYDWLSLPVSVNEKMLAWVERFVCMATEKGIDLSENVIGLLGKRIRESKSQSLYQAYIRYEVQALIRRKDDKAAVEQMLDAFPKDPTPFQATYPDLCAALQETAEGERILHRYYLEKANQLVGMRGCTYSSMVEFIAEYARVTDIQQVRELFCDKCRKILMAEQQKGKHFQVIYGAYQKAIQAIDPGRKIRWEEITDAYDRAFRTHFDSNRLQEYEAFYRRYTRYPWSGDFLKVWKAVGNKGFEVATEYVKRSCSLGQPYPLCPEEVQSFAKTIFEHALDNGAAAECVDMRFWYVFANVFQMDPIEFMVDNRAAVLCDPDTLEAAIDTDDFWWKLENAETIYEGCKRYCRENEEQEVLTKYTLRILKEQLTILQQKEKDANRGNRGGGAPLSVLRHGIEEIKNVGQRFKREKQESGLQDEDMEKRQKRK